MLHLLLFGLSIYFAILEIKDEPRTVALRRKLRTALRVVYFAVVIIPLLCFVGIPPFLQEKCNFVGIEKIQWYPSIHTSFRSVVRLVIIIMQIYVLLCFGVLFFPVSVINMSIPPFHSLSLYIDTERFFEYMKICFLLMTFAWMPILWNLQRISQAYILLVTCSIGGVASLLSMSIILKRKA